MLTKALLMEHFDDVVTDPAVHLTAPRDFAVQRQDDARFLDRYWVMATSGSSGQPGFFLFDEPEWLSSMASFAPWPGVAGRAD